jgi:uncharacterized LabA/DUF88 family protein
MRVLLIDGSNFHEAAKSINLRVDYKKLRELFAEDNQLLRAYYFTALPNRSVQSQIIKTVDWLSYNGYVVVSKEYSEFINNGEKKIKGNMDLEIAAYMYECAEIVDEIYLLSGDGDFTIIVQKIQQKHKVKVTCVSSMKMISSDLRKQCDSFINLEVLRGDIQQEIAHDVQ